MQKKWRALGAGGFFFVAGTIENGTWPILLPTIARHFDVSTSAVVWILVAFALGMAGSSLTAGRIGDLLGHKRVATIGFIAEGSIILLIPFMPVFWYIIPLRFVQGIARATGLNSIGALVVGAFPQEERGRILGLRNGLAAAGLLLGPLYAGLIGQLFGWRIAVQGVVVGYVIQIILVTVLARNDIPQPGRALATLRRLDWAGALAFLIAICTLIYSAQLLRGDDTRFLGAGSLVFSVAMFLAAVRFERRSAAPVLNLGLFKSPAFSSAGAALITFSMASGAALFLFPFYMQSGLGWSLAFAGSVLITLNFVQVWGSPLMGYLSDRISPRHIQATGVVVMVAGLTLASRLGSGPEVWQVVVVMLMLGSAASLFGPPNNKVIYNAVPPDALGSANAISAVGRYIGQSLGGAIGAALLVTYSDRGVPAAFGSAMMILAVLVGVIVTTALFSPLIVARRQAVRRM